MRYIAFSCLLTCLLAGTFVLAGCSQPAESKGGVGVVDLERLEQESELLGRIQQHMEALSQKFMVDVLAAEKAQEEDPSDENAQRLDVAMTTLQEAMYAEEQRLSDFLRTELDRILTEHREQNGLDVLLLKDAVAAYSPSADVTDDITAALDALDPGLEVAPAVEETVEPAEQKEQ